MSAATCFSVQMDELARCVGGWPETAVAYAAEVIGSGEDPQVLLTGEVPVGLKRDGKPKFGTQQMKYRAVIQLSEYRAALKVSA